jgi:uncharacterized protein (TIGR02147 family)
MKSKRLSTPVFVFEDYVDYLRAWYDYARRFGLTQQELMTEAGIGAKAFLSDVLARRKKIGVKHVPGFIKALGLSGDEAEYFSLLVDKCNMRDPYEKELRVRSMAHIRRKKVSAMLTGTPTTEYFSDWIYPVLREYIMAKGSAASAKELQEAFLHLKPQRNAIERALKKLCRWGLIYFDADEKAYRPGPDQSIISYKEMPHAVVNDVKRSLIEAAVHSMETLPEADRHISMAIRGMRRESYEKFCAKIDGLRREFLELDQGGEGMNDRVYSLTVQLFPVAGIPSCQTDNAGLH